MTQQQSHCIQWSRDYLKCDQCRREHKKCQPQPRDWDGEQQRCNRCCHLGHPCGPPERKQRLVSADRNDVTESPRPTRREASRQDVLTANMIAPAISYSSSTETQARHEWSHHLISLAVMIATHELLLLQLLLLGRTGHNSVTSFTNAGLIGDTIITHIGWLDRAFKRKIQFIQATVPRTEDSEKYWKMCYLEERHSHLLSIKSSIQAQAYISIRCRGAVNLPLDTAEARILACTSSVFHDLATESCPQVEQPHLTPGDYLDLESHIENLLQDIRPSDNNASSAVTPGGLENPTLQELGSFSAAHIAHLNRDRRIAMQLWDRPSDHLSGIDVLGRSFVHIVAASGDLWSMKKILEHSPRAVKLAHPDQLGLYPIDLASDGDSQDMRSLLRCAGAQSASDPHRLRPESMSSSLASRAETQDCSLFANMLRHGEMPTSTATEIMEDLESSPIISPELRMVHGMAMGIPTNLDQYPGMNQNLAYDNHTVYGQQNTFQSARPWNTHGTYRSSNTLYTIPGNLYRSNPNYDPSYDAD